MKISLHPQGTDGWFMDRCGVPTASNFNKIVTSKGERSSQRKKYLYELAGEKITGVPKEGYKNAHMDRGNEREQEGRESYEFRNDVKIEQVGFCLDDSGLYGASPDGLVGEDGGFENKDASPHVQIERLEKGWNGTEHFAQVQGNLLVTGRKWWDLQSYSRGIQPIVIRMFPDEEFLKKLKVELILFNKDLNSLVEKYSL